ncbi:MAG TPA: hypothetical protein VNN07_10690 [Candidatus Tectomicrobia bacterium]|nr:hypothetical protein [Candidatus Tectomicrobia bacterium]
MPLTFMSFEELERYGVSRDELLQRGSAPNLPSALSSTLKHRLADLLVAHGFDVLAPVFFFESTTKQGFHLVQ